MKWPPYVMQLGFGDGEHRFWLWIPLFLIGPIVLVFVLAIFAIILPFALLALVFAFRWDWIVWLFQAMAGFFRVVVNMPGVKVDVDTDKGKVYIAIY